MFSPGAKPKDNWTVSSIRKVDRIPTTCNLQYRFVKNAHISRSWMLIWHYDLFLFIYRASLFQTEVTVCAEPPPPPPRIPHGKFRGSSLLLSPFLVSLILFLRFLPSLHFSSIIRPVFFFSLSLFSVQAVVRASFGFPALFSRELTSNCFRIFLTTSNGAAWVWSLNTKYQKGLFSVDKKKGPEIAVVFFAFCSCSLCC